jgi:hypothetical protein
MTPCRPYQHILKSNTPIPLDDPIWLSFLADNEALGTDARDMAAVMVSCNSQTHNFVKMIRLTVQQLHDTMVSACALWGASPPSSPVQDEGESGESGSDRQRRRGSSGSKAAAVDWTAEQVAQTLTVVKVMQRFVCNCARSAAYVC